MPPKTPFVSEPEGVAADQEDYDDDQDFSDAPEEQDDDKEALERRIRLKVDIRLCSIAGILCSLDLLDSGVISSASVTSMLSDLGLDQVRIQLLELINSR
jgi:hypothetical protein